MLTLQKLALRKPVWDRLPTAGGKEATSARLCRRFSESWGAAWLQCQTENHKHLQTSEIHPHGVFQTPLYS